MMARKAALLTAMAYPSLMAWFYFVVLAGDGGKANPLFQSAYSVGKLLQFAFPILCFRLFRGAWPNRPRWTWAGMGLGLGFGLAAGLAIVLLYNLYLCTAESCMAAPERIRKKVEEFGLGSPAGFILLGAGLSLVHSLLEEYYWRWYVFGELRDMLPSGAAIVVSSLAFMAHHVIILAVYFRGFFLEGTLPFSLGVAVGGAYWAWLYQRKGSLWATWLSHAMVDGGIMVVGYQMIWGK